MDLCRFASWRTSGAICTLQLLTGCAPLVFRDAAEVPQVERPEVLAKLNSATIGSEFPVKRAAPPALPAPQLVDHPMIRSELALLQKRGGKSLLDAWRRFAPYRHTVEAIFRDEGVPADLIQLAFVESRFDPRAKSPRGALGIWQFMRSTARLYGLKCGVLHDERRDVIRSSIAAARHLRDLYQAFGNWELALAAYNAGPAAVDRAIQREKSSDFWRLAAAGRLPKQTRNYVPKVYAAVLMHRHPERYGLQHPFSIAREEGQHEQGGRALALEDRTGARHSSPS